jgi:hypothetical protein
MFIRAQRCVLSKSLYTQTIKSFSIKSEYEEIMQENLMTQREIEE